MLNNEQHENEVNNQKHENSSPVYNNELVDRAFYILKYYISRKNVHDGENIDEDVKDTKKDTNEGAIINKDGILSEVNDLYDNNDDKNNISSESDVIIQKEFKCLSLDYETSMNNNISMKNTESPINVCVWNKNNESVIINIPTNIDFSKNFVADENSQLIEEQNIKVETSCEKNSKKEREIVLDGYIGHENIGADNDKNDLNLKIVHKSTENAGNDGNVFFNVTNKRIMDSKVVSITENTDINTVHSSEIIPVGINKFVDVYKCINANESSIVMKGNNYISDIGNTNSILHENNLYVWRKTDNNTDNMFKNRISFVDNDEEDINANNMIKTSNVASKIESFHLMSHFNDKSSPKYHISEDKCAKIFKGDSSNNTGDNINVHNCFNPIDTGNNNSLIEKEEMNTNQGANNEINSSFQRNEDDHSKYSYDDKFTQTSFSKDSFEQISNEDNTFMMKKCEAEKINESLKLILKKIRRLKDNIRNILDENKSRC